MNILTKNLFQNSQQVEYLRERGVSDLTAQEFGLGYLDKTQFLDTLRGPGIVFPIHDLFEKLVGHIIRREESPKYMLTSFPKSRYLYGLNKSWRDIVKAKHAIVVEGIFDFLVLWENGIKNVVSAMTNSLSKLQAWSLFCFCNSAIFLYDGDNKRGKIDGREFLTVMEKKIPFNDDPDSFLLKNGIEVFRKYIIDM